MSKPANKTLIGIFVMGAFALVVLAVVVLGSGRFFKQTYPYVMYFEGSVKGLSVGAPVTFRGVKVATVTAIKMQIDAKDFVMRIPVYVEFGGEAQAELLGAPAGFLETFRREGARAHHELIETLIERGLRAQLEMQSIVTGQLQIALDFHPDKPTKTVGGDPNTPEIPTIPTPLQEFTKKIQELPIAEIFKKMDSTLEGISRVVNSPEIAQTLRSISQTAEETRGLAHHVSAKVGPAVSGIESAVSDARQLIQNLDAKIGPAVSSVTDTAKEVQKLAQDTQKLVEDVRKLSQNVNDQVQPLSASAQDSLKEAQKLLRGLDEKTTTLTSRMDEALKDTQGLIRNADGQIGPVTTSLKNTLASIERTSDEAGLTLQQAQQTLKSVEGDMGGESELVYEFNQALRDVRALAKAIRDLADTLGRQPESAIFGKKKHD